MPYIPQANRAQLDNLPRPQTPGELNYVFTKLWLNYLMDKGGPSYQLFNDIVGAYECSKLELYFRHVIPYESLKKDQNGDVYPSEAV